MFYENENLFYLDSEQLIITEKIPRNYIEVNLLNTPHVVRHMSLIDVNGTFVYLY